MLRTVSSRGFFLSAIPKLVLLLKGMEPEPELQRACGDVSMSGIVYNSRLLGSIYYVRNTPNILDCVKLCLLQKLCVSFNYLASSGQCELNNAQTSTLTSSGVTLNTTPGYNYANINYFPQKLAGRCGTKPCGTESMCAQSSSGFQCIHAHLCYNATTASYLGTLNVTKQGTTCQRWDARIPHTPMFFPSGIDNASLAIHVNYCRIAGDASAWCYTTDPNTRWNFCSVPVCLNNIDSGIE